MKRGITTVAALSLLVVAGIATCHLVPAIRSTARSIHTFQSFTAAVRNNDWDTASSMFQSVNTNWIRIEGHAIKAYNTDITSRVTAAKPLFFKTLEYYLTDSAAAERDKVVFAGGRAGIRDGQVVSIKTF